MCLRLLHSRKEKQKIIDSLKTDEDGYVSLCKIVYVREDVYSPRFRSSEFRSYKKGLDEAKRPWWKSSTYGILAGKFYKHGFYFTVQEQEDEHKQTFGPKTIICKIKKEWITATGVDEVSPKNITIIAKKAMFPVFQKER